MVASQSVPLRLMGLIVADGWAEDVSNAQRCKSLISVKAAEGDGVPKPVFVARMDHEYLCEIKRRTTPGGFS